jgi:hypothetical protein
MTVGPRPFTFMRQKFFLFLVRAWQTGSRTSRAFIPLKPKDGLTPISCHAVLESCACAPFIKERRMRCINATSLRRKSGQMGHPAFVASKASSHAEPKGRFLENRWMALLRHGDQVFSYG